MGNPGELLLIINDAIHYFSTHYSLNYHGFCFLEIMKFMLVAVVLVTVMAITNGSTLRRKRK
jgi:hypothetical protein